MRWGAVNKALEVIVVMVFNQFDGGMHLDIFRNSSIAWFCICEGASMFENLVLLGVPCPDGLQQTLAKLKVGISISFVDILERLVEERLHLKKGEDSSSDNEKDRKVG